MKSLKRRVGISLISFGIDPRRTVYSVRSIIGYIVAIVMWFRHSKRETRTQFPFRFLPTLSDKHSDSGVASGHYFHQDLWAARQIYERQPSRHIDVGSRIDGFIAHLLCFRNVEVVDIRSLNSKIRGLTFHQADLMSSDKIDIQPAPSVSCLHALEHFGLNRYGDPISPDGWKTGFAGLADLVAAGGLLYLGVPIGRPAVEFNAQRIFHPRYIIDEASKLGLTLHSWACVNDNGDFESLSTPVDPDQLSKLAKFDYGCGLFVFKKSTL